jgi:acyl dehydratase
LASSIRREGYRAAARAMSIGETGDRMLTINGADELRSRLGEELGVASWVTVDQALIDDFARVTGDDQWIHIDPARAAQTPFGSTIGHGLLTLSLGPKMVYEIFEVTGFAYGLNYGYGKVRFPAPVPVGSKVRMRATLSAVEDVPGGMAYTITEVFEIEGGAKPVCVAEQLVRVFD